MIKKSLYFFCFNFLAAISSFGQTVVGPDGNNSGADMSGRLEDRRVITTAVPFLTISPDARAGALGDAGAATSPDANSIYWNPAKLAFAEKDMGVSLSYTPWLRKLVGDMSLSYLTGYKKLTKEQAIGFHLMYFNLGSIQFMDAVGNQLNVFNPREFSTGLTYSRKLSEDMSFAVGMKYIHSNLAGSFNIASTGNTTKPGNTAAVDLGWYWNRDIMLGSNNSHLAFGATISNLGAKISYTDASQRDFIPTNLRLGTALTTELDPFNKITFIFDVNKLMVPTPPIDNTTNPADQPLLAGVFGSFADAPGGFTEEMRELYYAGGIEYWYNDLFAIRGGYFHEHRLKGNRKYFTMGFGIRYQVFGLDFAYLVPMQQNHPLAETLRFTLHINFDNPGVEQTIND